MIEDLITAAMRSLDHAAIIGLAVFKQSIKLIEEPVKEPDKKKK